MRVCTLGHEVEDLCPSERFSRGESLFDLSTAEAQMKIGELAHRAGLNASAIRYYEKIGLLPSPTRTSGQRRYSSEALDRVLLIRFAGEMGFTLSEIRIFLSGIRESAPVGPRWKKLAARKILEMRQIISRARRLEKLMRGLYHCQCSSLNECVHRLELSPRRRAIASPASKSISHLAAS